MFKNYLKIALRNIFKHKINSFINIFGLSVGISFCIMIFLYIKSEQTYDRFHKNAEQVYIVKANYKNIKIGKTPALTGPTMKEDFPEIFDYVRLDAVKAGVKLGDDLLQERIHITDPSFFSVFTFPFEKGNPSSPLNSYDDIIISSETAIKYFNMDDPTGETITINLNDRSFDFIVSGVVRIPDNSSIKFSFLIPLKKYTAIKSEGNQTNADRSTFTTFIQAAPNADIINLSKKLPSYIISRLSGSIKKTRGFKAENYTLKFMKLTDYHLTPGYPVSGMTPRSNPKNSWILSGIGFMVLLIACFNFMNITIARSSSRFKEIGVRKVMGALRLDLIRQFWFESSLLCCIALIFGLVLTELSLPYFNNLANKNMTMDIFSSLTMIFVLSGIFISISTLAGSYPAALLSNMKLVEIFKGKMRVGGRNTFSRIIVFVQFALSLFLILGSAIIIKQKDFLYNGDLGFNKNNVIVVPVEKSRNSNISNAALGILRKELEGVKGVSSISGASRIFNVAGSASGMMVNNELVWICLNRIDYDYLNIMNISLKDGRNFSKDIPADPVNSVIINETLAEKLKIENPVGKTFNDYSYGKMQNPTIIGVVNDFHFLPYHQEIQPMVLHIYPESSFKFFVIKINSQNTAGIISSVKKAWTKLFPGKAFGYYFLDEEIKFQYIAEDRWSKIIGYSSVFAMFIAILGLFGLTGIIVSKRIKEIGIRKVLGASTYEIVKIINRDFTKTLLLANIIVWPAAYYAGSIWLRNFAYKTDIGLSIFIVSGAALVILSLATIGSQAVKAALTDPVRTLRDE